MRLNHSEEVTKLGGSGRGGRESDSSGGDERDEGMICGEAIYEREGTRFCIEDVTVKGMLHRVRCGSCDLSGENGSTMWTAVPETVI